MSNAFPSTLKLGGRRWLKLLVPLVTLRAASVIWGVANVDETTLFTIGRMIRAGALPYVGVVDNKPILAYFAFVPGTWFGWRLWPLQVLAISWIFATAYVLAKVVERWTGDREAGWIAAWLAILATACSVPAISTEMLFNLPIALGLLCSLEAGRRGWRWDVASGLCIAIASLLKHQAGVALFAMGLGVLLSQAKDWPQRLARLLALGAGFALPWVTVGAAYAKRGSWAPFLDWNVLRNISYSQHDPTSAWLLLGEGVVVGIVIAAPVAWVLAVRAIRPSWQDDFGRMAVLLLAFTCVAVSVGGRFYFHYFLQFIPPLVVLAAPEAATLIRGWPSLRTSLRWSLVAGIALPAAFWGIYGPVRGMLRAFPAQEPRAVAIASWVRTHSKPSDRIFVWGSYSPIYYLAQRLPATRYVDAAVLAGNFDPSHVPDGFDVRRYQSAADVAAAIEDLKRSRPALFIDTAPANLHDWRHFPLADFPSLASFVRENYSLAGHAAGATIYRWHAGPVRSPELTRVTELSHPSRTGG